MYKNQIKKVTVLALALVIAFTTFALAKEIKTVEIKTQSVQCGMCKKTIEKALSKIDGIISVDVDYKKKVTTIKFDAEKITLEKIRKHISKAGYDADDVKADKEAYNNLHNCCKLPKDR